MIKKIIISLSLLSCISLLSLPLEARLYKWVDSDGNIRYGDQLPPEYNNKRHQQLDSEGRIIITKEAGKSPALIKKERAEAKKLKQQQKLEAIQAEEDRKRQAKQDKILLLTFNSEEDIFYARDQRLLIIDSKINLLNKSILSSQETLMELDHQATMKYRSKQLEVPGGLQQKIEQFSKSILTNENNIRSSEHKRSEVEGNFQKDLVRFRDLKARQRKQDNADNKE